MGVNEDLDVIEKSIRQLQIEWEKFFGGVERKPPVDAKTKLEALLRRYANAELRNNTERFRFQNLTSRYQTFSELWAKRLRAMEEGRPMGLHGKAAAMAMPPMPASPPPLPERHAAAARAAGGGEVRVKDPSADTEAVRALFDRFLEARKQAGENAAVKFESFQKIIAQQSTRILNEKGAQAVDFRLETKDGKVSLKAKPVR
jgi:hypothetical protein